MMGIMVIALTWTDVPFWAVVIVGFPVLFVVVCLLDLRASKKKGAAFAADREDLSDEEFVRRAGGSPDEGTCESIRVVRKAFEVMTSIPVPALHPEDKMADILSLPWVDFDFVEFIMQMEDELHIVISEKAAGALWNRLGPERTLGEFAMGMADYLARRPAESA